MSEKEEVPKSLLRTLQEEIEGSAGVDPDVRARWVRMLDIEVARQASPIMVERELRDVLNRVRAVSGPFPSPIFREITHRIHTLLLRGFVPAPRAQWAALAFDVALEDQDNDSLVEVFLRMFPLVLQSEAGRRAFAKAIRGKPVLGAWSERTAWWTMSRWLRCDLEGNPRAEMIYSCGEWVGRLLSVGDPIRSICNEDEENHRLGVFGTPAAAFTAVDRAARDQGYFLVGGIPTGDDCGYCAVPLDSEMSSAERLVNGELMLVCSSCSETLDEQPDGSEGEWP